MLRIEPTTTNIKNFKSYNKRKVRAQSPNGDKTMLAPTLIGLTTIAASIAFLTKTSKKSYNEALKKAGVQIKDNIAILDKSGEKFTGKIQRYENRNRKETINFVDGIITEKLYHDIFGKEIEGEFYKDGKKVLKIWKSTGQAKGTRGYKYHEEGTKIIEDGNFIETKNGFEWARQFIKKK